MWCLLDTQEMEAMTELSQDLKWSFPLTHKNSKVAEVQ
jgi:hypothetical protein